MNVLDILVGPVTKILDKVIPDPQAKAQAQLEMLRLNQAGEFKEIDSQLQRDLAQVEINKIEAGSDSFFKSGWRPAVGWTCAGGLAYQILIRPLIGWTCANLWGWTAPPSLEMDTLLTLLFSMLGLGAYRTAEKIKGAT
jgi:hypothetical protein